MMVRYEQTKQDIITICCHIRFWIACLRDGRLEAMLLSTKVWHLQQSEELDIWFLPTNLKERSPCSHHSWMGSCHLSDWNFTGLYSFVVSNNERSTSVCQKNNRNIVYLLTLSWDDYKEPKLCFESSNFYKESNLNSSEFWWKTYIEMVAVFVPDTDFL